MDRAESVPKWSRERRARAGGGKPREGTKPCVVWSRYKERDARFAAGLESSFSSFGETSLVVLTHRCQMLKMEGRLPREPKLQSEPMGG